MTGAGQAHFHQHLTAMQNVMDCGAAAASSIAFKEAGLQVKDMNYLGIYDSFTITLTMLLEEIGFAPRAGAAKRLRQGDFSKDGDLPLNTHGGLLSFGHSGVAGGMAHLVETYRQCVGQAANRQVRIPEHAFVHADGGVMSSHVSLILSREA